MSDSEFVIPGYEIQGLIGQGGFAKVYLAIQKSLDRIVALKIMEPEMASDQQFCERFVLEGRIVAKLSDHPNIVTIFDIGKKAEFYFMAMEYLGGGNLRQRVKKGEGERIDFIRMLRQVASALGYVHDAGFVHRDIKPGNILFTNDNVAKLSDFGIAKCLDSATQLTQVGYTVGTPEYMSPEQTLAQTLDGRSDLYSLGVVAYEFLTGEKPFAGDDAFAIAYKQINEPVPRLPEACAEHQELIDRLMAKAPEERFQTVAELLDFLGGGEAQADSGFTDGSGTVTSRAASSLTQRKRFTKSLVLLAGMGGLVLGGAIWFWGLGAKVDNPQAITSPAIDLKPPEVEDARVMRLLDVATAHEAMGRVTEPPGSNACEAYALVLESDPGNRFAKTARSRLACP